ncbi:MAG: F0F1 ATP synthase subunit B [Chloroflexota bacterium]
MDAIAKLGINPIYLLSQIVVFSILAFALYKLLYNPILNVLDKRQTMIAKGLEDARLAGEARAKADQDAAGVLEEARRKSQQIVAEASVSAEQVKQNIVHDAEEEGRKIVARAHEDAQAERNQVLSEMRDQIGSLAVSAAEKIIGENLDGKRHKALLNQFFTGIEEGRIPLVEETAGLVGDSATITTALALEASEQQQFVATLGEKLGESAEISFNTDPSILGGVVVRIGDRVVDDSVAGKLRGLKGQLVSG